LRPSESSDGVAFVIYTSDPKVLGKRPGRGTVGCWIASGLLGERPTSAPVVHLGGPLSMLLASPGKATLVRGPKPSDLYVQVGTAVTQNARRFLALEEVPAGMHPVAEVEFPTRRGEPPIKVRYALTKRC